MSVVPDATMLNQMSIPGTHDTMTYNAPDANVLTKAAAFSVQTQSMDLQDQLNAGVRFLDIRLGPIESFDWLTAGWDTNETDLECYHASFNLDVDFNSVITTCENFLASHGGETIIMSVKDDYSPGPGGVQPALSTDHFDHIMQNILNANAGSWYTKNCIPDLGEVRGKIVLLRRYDQASDDSNPPGIDATNWLDNFAQPFTGGHLFIQDQYEPPDVATKETDILTLEAEMSQESSLWPLNFTNATGSTVSISAADSSDHPSWWSNQIDPWLEGELPSSGDVGTIVMDYPSADLIHEIYALDFDIPPSLTFDPLVVAKGATTQVTSNNLVAWDPYGFDLTYTVTSAPPSGDGTLLLNGTEPLGVGSQFTQNDIYDGLISYHDGGSDNSNDSFGFKVSDAPGTGTATGVMLIERSSLAVTTTADSDTSGSLRFAVQSAQSLGGSQVIHLGPGDYKITMPAPAGNLGDGGALDVAGVHLTIIGAGPGQTSLDGDNLNDIFSVESWASLTLEGITLKNGNASNQWLSGGAIFGFPDSELDLDHCVVTNNTSEGGGGGIATSGDLTVTNSTISDNSTFGEGAGIWASGTTTIANSTIESNVGFPGSANITNPALGTDASSALGAGIYNDGNLTINDSTLYGNRAFFASGSPVEGAGIYNAAFLWLINTIVANNETENENGNTYHDDVYGAVYSGSAYNLIGGSADMWGVANRSNGNLIGTPAAPVDPMLTAADQADGPIPTLVPLPGSPVIGAGVLSGNTPPTDERGYARPTNGHVDIGADQYQYDLELSDEQSAFVLGGVSDIQMMFTVTNNGPDAAANVTLTVALPAGFVFLSTLTPAGWTTTTPGMNNGGTVHFTDTNTLGPQDGPMSFVVLAEEDDAPAGTSARTTATITPSFSDIDPSAESQTLTVINQVEDQRFQNVNLFHFTPTDSQATAADFYALVLWGDNTEGASGDGTVSVVADPEGGFDVLGSHAYAEEGGDPVSVLVNGPLNGTASGLLENQEEFAVEDAPLTALSLTPPTPAIEDQPIVNAKLFHFSDADAAAAASDYRAYISWGDGAVDMVTSAAGSAGQIVPDPNGGFDVIGSHTYTQVVNSGTFAVQIFDAGGSTTSESTNDFNVLDAPLSSTPADLTPPAATEGVAFSNVTVLRFTDADPNASVTDYTATVNTGDGQTLTFGASTGGSGAPIGNIVADPTGGFDVELSHTYAEEFFGSFSVSVKDVDGAATSESTNHFRVLDAPLTATGSNITTPAGSTVSWSVATFTDADRFGTAGDYTATIDWGDGTAKTTISGSQMNDVNGTFEIPASHDYAKAGTYTLSVAISDAGGATTTVTPVATVMPAPATITSVSSTTANGSYNLGAVIDVTVVFSDTVEVTGTPELTLNSGGTAAYVGGGGTTTLTFNYTVAAGQNAARLDEASTAALLLNGGTIADVDGGANVSLPAPGALGSLGVDSDIVIDTTPADVSPDMSVARAGYRYDALHHVYLQTLTITNDSGTALTGPLALVLSGLSSNAALTNATGSVGGDSFIDVLPPGGTLLPGQSVSIVLKFSNPSFGLITYGTQIWENL